MVTNITLVLDKLGLNLLHEAFPFLLLRTSRYSDILSIGSSGTVFFAHSNMTVGSLYAKLATLLDTFNST